MLMFVPVLSCTHPLCSCSDAAARSLQVVLDGKSLTLEKSPLNAMSASAMIAKSSPPAADTLHARSVSKTTSARRSTGTLQT